MAAPFDGALGARGGSLEAFVSRMCPEARTRNEAQLIIAFGDEAAAASVTGKSWLADALRA